MKVRVYLRNLHEATALEGRDSESFLVFEIEKTVFDEEDYFYDVYWGHVPEARYDWLFENREKLESYRILIRDAVEAAIEHALTPGRDDVEAAVEEAEHTMVELATSQLSYDVWFPGGAHAEEAREKMKQLMGAVNLGFSPMDGPYLEIRLTKDHLPQSMKKEPKLWSPTGSANPAHIHAALEYDVTDLVNDLGNMALRNLKKEFDEIDLDQRIDFKTWWRFVIGEKDRMKELYKEAKAVLKDHA